MTTYHITQPQGLHSDVKLPASKSISNRALIIYALTGADAVRSTMADHDRD